MYNVPTISRVCVAAYDLHHGFVLGMTDKQRINDDYYVWIALVLFPLNSALSPFLYTLTIIVRPKVMGKSG